MKFVISFLFVMPVLAAPIRIFHENNLSRAEIVKQIFLNTYQIPEDLIVIKNAVNCEELRLKGQLDMCLKNNGDLKVVSVDRAFVLESLKIFWAP